MFRIHTENPAEAVENAYFRIFRERMADVPIHNDALSVAAVDFQKWQGHWLGAIVTPWCLSLLLVPGKAEDWSMPGDNKRHFIKFPAGDFAFLGSDEAELGQFLSCSLFSPMSQFENQAQAEQTARSSLGLLLAPPAPASIPKPVAEEEKPKDEPSMSRRRFFGMGR